jgi:IMP dehydrogenase/GMP reductase
MPHISDELFNKFIELRILLRDQFVSGEEDPIKRIDEWVKWEKDYNVKWTNFRPGSSQPHTSEERWILNPLVPKYPVSLKFEDVAAVQGTEAAISRNHIDLTTELCRGIYTQIPLIPANMSTVCDASICSIMSQIGGIGILHRAWKSTEDYLAEVSKINGVKNYENRVSTLCASVGLGFEQLELAKILIQNGVKVIVIDVAHGFTEEIKLMCYAIRRYSKETKIIVGNVSNPASIEFYDKVADGVKVGLSNGSVCETRNTTGIIENQFSAIEKCAKRAKELGMPIISDGGVREAQDMVKAIGIGTNTVMAGKIFAACPESPAPVANGKKLYSGMSSRAVQESWRGKVSNNCPEGKTIELDIGEPVKDLVNRYCGALRSSISYTNSQNIKEFQEKVKFVIAKRCED